MLNLSQRKTIWAEKCFLTFLKKIIPIVVKASLYTSATSTIKTTRTRLFTLLGFLQGHILSQFNSLVDIIVYDSVSTKYRFGVVYNLLSITFNTRLLVCIYTNEILPIASVCSLFASANWLEREAWDLYGVFFINHPDLRRILTDYGFNYHPLRKDFPLSGHKEISYSEKEKRIIHSNVEILQAYRAFSFRNRWLGAV
jgi:NADH:ubiquinone oxidoreductase subunit C